MSFRFLAGVAVATVLSGPAQAGEWPSSLQLSALDGISGFGLLGAAMNDNSGVSVSGAGDVNGDGLDDLIVGANGAPYGNGFGSSYVVFGKAGGFSSFVDLSSLAGVAGFRLDGVAGNDGSGFSVSGAGDVNGDGFADLIVGASLADPNGNSASGSSYVVFGKASGPSSFVNLSSLNGATGFRLDGVAAGDNSGVSVSGAGDVNGDSFADLIVGASGAPNGISSGSSYVVFGKAGGFASVISLSSLNGTTGFRLDGAAADDRSGRPVSDAGDVNGDGFADLIVGAHRADPYGISSSGSSYVVFGKASGFASAIRLSSLNGTTGFRLDGAATGDRSGRSVSGAGDVNGDGFADLIVGAYRAPGGSYAGSSYVVFGKAGGLVSAVNLSGLNGATGFRLDGVAAGDRSGFAVSEAGDVNGDGFADLIVGAFGVDHNGNDSGSSYVVFGRAAGFESVINLSSLNGTTGFRLDGVHADERSGNSVSKAGDVNGDGFADVIVGAYNSSLSSTKSGSSYVVFGRAPDASAFRIGSRARQVIQGSAFVDVLIAADAGDVLEGRAGGDVLVGSIATTASYGHAASGVVASLASGAINVGDAFGDSYFGIMNLEGTGLNDALTGNGASNIITGGKGRDLLKGGNGKDTFVFRLSAESPPGSASRDQIIDLNPGTKSTVVDRIDLSMIDANALMNGNQAFQFRGTRAITGAGQLNMAVSGSDLVIRGNTGGSTAPEFEIMLKGLASKIGRITVKDFKL